MDISKYTSYFHDGSIIDIQHEGDNIMLSMASAEVDPEELQENIMLSKNDTISGRLHINEVVSVKINKDYFFCLLKKLHRSAEIFSFEVTDNFVEFQIIWDDFPPILKAADFSVIKIEAKNIYWENIPDLIDQFP